MSVKENVSLSCKGTCKRCLVSICRPSDSPETDSVYDRGSLDDCDFAMTETSTEQLESWIDPPSHELGF